MLKAQCEQGLGPLYCNGLHFHPHICTYDCSCSYNDVGCERKKNYLRENPIVISNNILWKYPPTLIYLSSAIVVWRQSTALAARPSIWTSEHKTIVSSFWLPVRRISVCLYCMFWILGFCTYLLYVYSCSICLYAHYNCDALSVFFCYHKHIGRTSVLPVFSGRMVVCNPSEITFTFIYNVMDINLVSIHVNHLTHFIWCSQ